MGVDPFPNAVLMLNEESLLCNYFIQPVLRVFNLSGFVARDLPIRHSALNGVRDETNEGVNMLTEHAQFEAGGHGAEAGTRWQRASDPRPPGTGKTFTGAHMICALSRAGLRVGVTNETGL